MKWLTKKTRGKILFVPAYCKSRIFRMHVIFVYFVRDGFRTKIKCMRKAQSKSRESVAVSDCTKISCVRKVGEPRIWKFSAYEIFWIYSTNSNLSGIIRGHGHPSLPHYVLRVRYQSTTDLWHGIVCDNIKLHVPCAHECTSLPFSSFLFLFPLSLSLSPNTNRFFSMTPPPPPPLLSP